MQKFHTGHSHITHRSPGYHIHFWLLADKIFVMKLVGAVLWCLFVLTCVCRLNTGCYPWMWSRSPFATADTNLSNPNPVWYWYPRLTVALQTTEQHTANLSNRYLTVMSYFLSHFRLFPNTALLTPVHWLTSNTVYSQDRHIHLTHIQIKTNVTSHRLESPHALRHNGTVAQSCLTAYAQVVWCVYINYSVSTHNHTTLV